MFKLQSPSKRSPFDAIHLSRCFLPLLRTVFELIGFLTQKYSKYSLEDFFHPGKQKKIISGQDGVNWEGWAWGHAVFGQKLLNTQCKVC